MKKRYCLLEIAMTAMVYTSSAQSASQNDSVITKMMNLDEVVVNATLVKHDSHSDEYRMIPKLTQGATSIYDVLSRLPGVAYNNLNNSISVRMNNNVLIEVNGNRVSQEYIQALSLDRISRIQVIYAPSARYTTEGIRYVINIKLKNDYVGHDLYVGNYTMISAGKNNGSDIVTNEQPKAQYIYSGKKIDITAGYGFATIHWNYPISYSRDYNGIASIKTEEISAKNPNDHNSTKSHAANLGIDWQIAPYQTLSFRGTFQNDNVKHQSIYNLTQYEIDRGTIGEYKELSNESSIVNEITGALYYQGMFRNGWTLYSALGYDRMRDNHDYKYNGNNFTNAEQYSNAKDYFRGELDLNYSFNDAIAINFGYRGIWNRYMTHNKENDILLSLNQEGRHNGYAFLDWSPKENFLLHIGSGVEIIHKKGLEQKRNWLEFLPQLTATWQPSNKVQLMAEYTTKMEYPSLYQVSITPNAIDRWLIQSGNPQLFPSRLQVISLQGTFFESLIIGAEYTLIHNSITDWYEKTGDNTFMRTFTNSRGKDFRAVAAYNWEITKSLAWNNIIQWQWQYIGSHEFSNHASNFSLQSNFEYWIKPITLLAKVEYSREMQKIPLLQGWQQYGQDLWQISLRKNFLNKSLSVSLNYVPPIHIGIRTNQDSYINTTFLNQKQSLNLHTYDNLFMLRIEWRFNKGRNKQRRVRQYEFDREQIRDKGLL